MDDVIHYLFQRFPLRTGSSNAVVALGLRQPFPLHAQRSEVPIWTIRDAGGAVVRISVACDATRDQRAFIVRPSNDAENVWVATVSLAWENGFGVTV